MQLAGSFQKQILNSQRGHWDFSPIATLGSHSSFLPIMASAHYGQICAILKQLSGAAVKHYWQGCFRGMFKLYLETAFVIVVYCSSRFSLFLSFKARVHYSQVCAI